MFPNLSVKWKQIHTILEFKGYLRYKTIFCNKVALDVKLMNFLFEKNVSFSRYPDFRVLVKSTNFKIRDVIIDIAA